MSEYTFIGAEITFPAIRDYIFTNKLDAGDTVVLHRHNFEELVEEMKTSGEELPEIPMNLLGVLITVDTTDSVPLGKVQIVKNEQQY